MKIRRLPTISRLASAPLPCAICPYGSACCTHGVDLTDSEAEKIIARWPGSVVPGPRSPRTALRSDGSACVFLDNAGRCQIHDQSEYPSTCRAYPLDQETGGLYEGEHVCPELENP